MSLAWVRTVHSDIVYTSGYTLLGKLNNGQTYVRTHFRWGFYADTAAIADMVTAAENLQIMGIVTTMGDGTEVPPDPRISPNDAAPPTLRWLWWEARQPIVTAIDKEANVITWRDSGPTEPTDIKAQVLATGVPSGQTLNLWATWAAASAWDITGNAALFFQASVLYKTP